MQIRWIDITLTVSWCFCGLLYIARSYPFLLYIFVHVHSRQVKMINTDPRMDNTIMSVVPKPVSTSSGMVSSLVTPNKLVPPQLGGCTARDGWWSNRSWLESFWFVLRSPQRLTICLLDDITFG